MKKVIAILASYSIALTAFILGLIFCFGGWSVPFVVAVGAGFTYFDTDLGKMIVSNGTDWVNMDGSALS